MAVAGNQKIKHYVIKSNFQNQKEHKKTQIIVIILLAIFCLFCIQRIFQKHDKQQKVTLQDLYNDLSLNYTNLKNKYDNLQAKLYLFDNIVQQCNTIVQKSMHYRHRRVSSR